MLSVVHTKGELWYNERQINNTLIMAILNASIFFIVLITSYKDIPDNYKEILFVIAIIFFIFIIIGTKSFRTVFKWIKSLFKKIFSKSSKSNKKPNTPNNSEEKSKKSIKKFITAFNITFFICYIFVLILKSQSKIDFEQEIYSISLLLCLSFFGMVISSTDSQNENNDEEHQLIKYLIKKIKKRN